MVVEEVVTIGFQNFYNHLVEILPSNLKIIPPLFLITLVIAIYSIFIWFFYRFLAKKDVLKLDLKKYNVYKYSAVIKFFAVLFYVLEFMIIAPIVIFFWFSILSIFFIVLAKDIEVGIAVLTCAGLIAAIRITAYIHEDLSKDLAKLVPFTLLGVVILTPNFLNIGTTIERITQIPLFLNTAAYYFLFIVCLEAILRLFYLPAQIAKSKKE